MAARASDPIDRATFHSAHWLDELPYRALVHVGDSAHGTPLYMVAGSAVTARKATSALKEALRIHGGRCFYCQADGDRVSAHLNVDHVDAISRGRCDLLHNLVIACHDCNLKKGALPIEAFRPRAGRAWLLAAQALIRARLELMPDDDDEPLG